MTLPFRRRHHDDEAPHDRAHALISAGFLGALSDADASWLEGHLGQCPECRADREGYVADRALLQSLRSAPPSPPRDLWARTAAAIEREAGHSHRGFLDRAIGPMPRGIPLGPLAGVAVAAVVLVVALLPPGTTVRPAPTGTPPPVALVTPATTPFAVDNQVAWLVHAPDGTTSIVFGEIDEVCADPSSGACAIAPGSPAPIAIGQQPQSVVISPTSGQVAVVPADDQPDGDLVIVSVATPVPTEAATPAAPSMPAPSMLVTPPASFAIESPGRSPLPSASVGPLGKGHAIIHGVVVVGEPAYSPDGQWFAFSARPKDGSRGPDLYAWRVGDDAATQLTTDGLTYFSGWFRSQIVASTVSLDAAVADPSAAPSGSAAAPTLSPPADASEAVPSGSPAATPAALELHPASFLIDPATRARTDFARPDVWLPSIDPSGRFVVYWSGTVTPGASGAAIGSPTASADATASVPSSAAESPIALSGITSLRPATGSLVLDGWSAALVLPSPSPDSSVGGGGSPSPAAVVTDSPSDAPATSPFDLGSPLPSSSPAVAEGPAGTWTVLADGPLTDFDARFDPKGTRLAIWTADPGDNSIGPLRLLVLDPATGTIDPTAQPLSAPGVVALRGFSIDAGRLGWVTPPGQNGQPSSVQVLAWKGDQFGQVRTVPGGNPQIVR